MLADLNKASSLVTLAQEARQDYETTRANKNAKAALVHYRREAMERALLDLEKHMSENWKRYYDMFMGSMGVPKLKEKKHGRPRSTV